MLTRPLVLRHRDYKLWQTSILHPSPYHQSPTIGWPPLSSIRVRIRFRQRHSAESERTPSSQRPGRVPESSESSERPSSPAVERTGHLLSPGTRTGRQYPSLSAPQALRPSFHRDIQCCQLPKPQGLSSQCLFAPRSILRHPSHFPEAHRQSLHSASERLIGR